MSTLWTPGGERPIRKDSEPDAGSPAAPSGRPEVEMTEEELHAEMAAVRDKLAQTPAEMIIANHAFGLFELAALHLSIDPPQLDQARLAIDALGLLVDGLGDRLGDHGQDLSAGLGQLRMAYVQIHGAHEAGAPEPQSAGPPPAEQPSTQAETAEDS